MSKKALVKIRSGDQKLRELQEEMQVAQEELRQVEALLGEEQAAVNAFRMHCRLKLGPWVDQIIDLYTEKQLTLIRKRMRQQAAEMGELFDEEKWLEDEGIDFDDDVRLDGLMEEAELPFEINTSARRLYRDLARKHHPDRVEGEMQKSYATSMMAAVNEAYSRRDMQALRDLAGELDPKAAAELAKGRDTLSVKAQKLQQQLRRCRQRRRRVTLQLKTLREETTAKLWRKAQSIDKKSGENWWDEIEQSLKMQIDQYRQELQKLQAA